MIIESMAIKNKKNELDIEMLINLNKLPVATTPVLQLFFSSLDYIINRNPVIIFSWKVFSKENFNKEALPKLFTKMRKFNFYCMSNVEMELIENIIGNEDF